jgi:hypothetical protein
LWVWAFDERQENHTLDEYREMIAKRLRPMFAETEKPLVIWHIVLGLFLLPIPALLTGWAYLLDLTPIISLPSALFLNPIVLFWLGVFSFLPIPIYLVWSLPKIHRVGLPKHSIYFLALLAIYNPIRLNLYRTIAELETREHVYTLHYKYIVLWEYKNVDSAFLLALAVWAFRRHRTMQPVEKTLFHWLLFVCAVWAICDYYEVIVGMSL